MWQLNNTWQEIEYRALGRNILTAKINHKPQA